MFCVAGFLSRCDNRPVGKWLEHARRLTLSLKRDVVALWLAARDRRTPWYAKAAAAMVAAYALSPIDLIPDFIPVLGYIDDLLIVPLGILIAIRLIPAALMAEFRAKAKTLASKPVSKTASVAIVLIWLLVLTMLAYWTLRSLR